MTDSYTITPQFQEGTRRPEGIDDEAGTDPIESGPGAALVPVRNRARALAERGLTTIEYAIGLLAAATAALVLLRVFNDNIFFQTMFEWVLGTLKNVIDTP